MRTLIFTAALAVSALIASTASADVRLTINNGRVTLSAQNATVGQILAEWARVGRTKIVNAERIAGGPLTLELANVPEREALQVLLRSVSGYVAAPRAETIANASQFDRILVMPTSSPARPPAPGPAGPTFQQPQFTPPPFQMPQFQTPQFPPAAARVDDDDDGDQPAPSVPPNGIPQIPRGPVFNTFPPPRIATPQAPTGPAASPTPTAPAGVSTPGMVVPVPQQPGQVGVPNIPNRLPDGRIIN
jgi:hypothetical protein